MTINENMVVRVGSSQAYPYLDRLAMWQFVRNGIPLLPSQYNASSDEGNIDIYHPWYNKYIVFKEKREPMLVLDSPSGYKTWNVYKVGSSICEKRIRPDTHVTTGNITIIESDKCGGTENNVYPSGSNTNSTTSINGKKQAWGIVDQRSVADGKICP